MLLTSDVVLMDLQQLVASSYWSHLIQEQYSCLLTGQGLQLKYWFMTAKGIGFAYADLAKENLSGGQATITPRTTLV